MHKFNKGVAFRIQGLIQKVKMGGGWMTFQSVLYECDSVNGVVPWGG